MILYMLFINNGIETNVSLDTIGFVTIALYSFLYTG